MNLLHKLNRWLFGSTVIVTVATGNWMIKATVRGCHKFHRDNVTTYRSDGSKVQETSRLSLLGRSNHIIASFRAEDIISIQAA